MDKIEEQIPDKNLFMICEKLNYEALRELPDGYFIRNCKKDELDIWKSMHFDNPDEARDYKNFMTDFFNDVYADKADLFFEKCLFICDIRDNPIATGFVWKVYDNFNTIHWFKVIKEYEGKGIGRGLLSIIMKNLNKEDYPVYLHTQPSSYRAIKLYSDFGFKFLTNPVIGSRNNDLKESLPILKKYMSNRAFDKLEFVKAPSDFLDKVGCENQF